MFKRLREAQGKTAAEEVVGELEEMNASKARMRGLNSAVTSRAHAVTKVDVSFGNACVNLNKPMTLDQLNQKKSHALSMALIRILH